MIKIGPFNFALSIFIFFFMVKGKAQNDTFKTSLSPYIGLSMGLPFNKNHVIVNVEGRPINRRYSLNYFGTYSKLTLNYPSFFGAFSREEVETIISIGVSKILFKKYFLNRRAYINFIPKISSYTEKTILYYKDSTISSPRVIGASLIGSLNLAVNLNKKYAIIFSGDLSYNKNIFKFDNRNKNMHNYFRKNIMIGMLYFF